MKKNKLNVGFQCLNCNKTVMPIPRGSFRNHCPFCLFSLHLDKDSPGDRISECTGLMEPIGTSSHRNKGLQLIHRCISCGKVQRNIIYKGLCQPDNEELLYHFMNTAHF